MSVVAVVPLYGILVSVNPSIIPISQATALAMFFVVHPREFDLR
jgi:hypothetical protein